MHQNHDETMRGLYGLKRLGIRPGLRSIEALLRELGNPEKSLRAVHIAGTNGKGSTAAMIDSVARAAGLCSGLYTSPHLTDFCERIQVSGRPIDRPALTRLAQMVLDAARRLRRSRGLEVTFFEAATAIAFLYFREEGVEIGVLETGMGGRLDATNVLTPLVSVITDVEMDHTEYLGHNIRAIAGEKAGIIKSGVPLVTGVMACEAAEVLEESAVEAGGVKVLCLGRDFDYEESAEGGLVYEGPGFSLEDLCLGLRGRFQKRNAALAITVLSLLSAHYPSIDETAIRRGLKEVRWPGRFEEINATPLVIADGAHNEAGARALSLALEEALPSGTRVTLVAGVSRGKDARGILCPLLPIARRVILTVASTDRALPARELSEAARALGRECLVRPHVSEALSKAKEGLLPGEVILVTGSLFVVGEAREFFMKRVKDPQSGETVPGLRQWAEPRKKPPILGR